jgi:hypothetical protein
MRRIYTPNDFKIPTGHGWDFDLQQFTGSGAGLNYDAQIVARWAAKASGTYDTGPVLAPASSFFSKTGAQIIAQTGTTAITGWSVACYGTYDFRAYLMSLENNVDPFAIPPGFTLPGTSWVQWALPQSETTPTWANPLTGFGVSAFSPEPWVAVRFVATCTSASGDIAIAVVRIP